MAGTRAVVKSVRTTLGVREHDARMSDLEGPDLLAEVGGSLFHCCCGPQGWSAASPS